MIVCNVTCADNLHEAKVMARSVKQHMPEVTMVTCLVEKQLHPAANASYIDRVFLPHELDIPDFKQFMFKYPLLSAVTAIKPFLLEYLFRVYPEERDIVFLDSDMRVYHSFDNLTAMLDRNPILLTPHHIEPKHVWSLHLFCGIYNTAFIALRRSQQADDFLKWWGSRLYWNCTFDNGLFVDQKWTELAIIYFDAGIIKDPGYNAALWNFHEDKRKIEKSSFTHRYQLNSGPLYCFHYSGLETGIQYWMDIAYPKPNAPIRKMVREYEQEIEDMGLHELVHEPWSYNYFDSGEKINEHVRDRFRNELLYQNRYLDPYMLSNGILKSAGLSNETSIPAKEAVRVVKRRKRGTQTKLLRRKGKKRLRSLKRSIKQIGRNPLRSTKRRIPQVSRTGHIKRSSVRSDPGSRKRTGLFSRKSPKPRSRLRPVLLLRPHSKRKQR